MSLRVADLDRALRALDTLDLASVSLRGLQSLDSDSSDVDQDAVDAAWRDELRRRIDEIESGKVELLDLDEVHAQIRAELAAMRT
jgi:putative addiction module component (TIGR02574 family)